MIAGAGSERPGHLSPPTSWPVRPPSRSSHHLHEQGRGRAKGSQFFGPVGTGVCPLHAVFASCAEKRRCSATDRASPSTTGRRHATHRLKRRDGIRSRASPRQPTLDREERADPPGRIRRGRRSGRRIAEVYTEYQRRCRGLRRRPSPLALLCSVPSASTPKRGFATSSDSGALLVDEFQDTNAAVGACACSLSTAASWSWATTLERVLPRRFPGTR